MPAAASEPKQLAYQVKNRAKYNESLVTRGNITLRFSDEVIDEVDPNRRTTGVVE